RPPAPTGPSSGLPGVVSAPCGVRTTKPATDRCTGPVLPTCPPVPDLLCVTSVSGIPFEYVMNSGWVVKGAGGLYVVKNRSARKQNFTPAVAGAVARFISNMASIGMPVEAILTGGSYYCRCISHTNTLSNHSFGDAIDVAGIRWRSPTGSRETIVHNYANPGERAILRRINACLRLSFANVIDYHRTDHRDHFHCDTNRGKGRYPKGSTSVVFIKEALNKIMGLGIPETTAYDAATAKGLRDFSGRTADELSNTATLNKVLDDLFARVARG
ncbi:MAG TPA: extensin family protein, partial [Pyrinomonadaceae bacterium]|nr:extensin family protein [Pyrinomonadaceae bacterium]